MIGCKLLWVSRCCERAFFFLKFRQILILKIIRLTIYLTKNACWWGLFQATDIWIATSTAGRRMFSRNKFYKRSFIMRKNTNVFHKKSHKFKTLSLNRNADWFLSGFFRFYANYIKLYFQKSKIIKTNKVLKYVQNVIIWNAKVISTHMKII